MFEVIPIDSTTKEELIEALERFDKTAVPKLMSKRGTEYLKKKHGKLDEQEYLTGLLDAKEKARARIKKLENKEMFSQKFIDEIRYSFEHIFMIIKEQLGLYDDKLFCEEQMKNFEKLKEIYKKMYPNTNFDFNALLKGKTPYGDDYVRI